jgi:hypothetical protein
MKNSLARRIVERVNNETQMRFALEILHCVLEDVEENGDLGWFRVVEAEDETWAANTTMVLEEKAFEGLAERFRSLAISRPTMSKEREYLIGLLKKCRDHLMEFQTLPKHRKLLIEVLAHIQSVKARKDNEKP